MSPTKLELFHKQSNSHSSSNKIDTPSFNNSLKISRLDSGPNKHSRKSSLQQTLEFDDSSSMLLEFPGLSNIPEVLDESNIGSEATIEMRKSAKFGSNHQTSSNENIIQSPIKLSNYFTVTPEKAKKWSNGDISQDRSFDRIAGAFDNFLGNKSSSGSHNPTFGDAE